MAGGNVIKLISLIGFVMNLRQLQPNMYISAFKRIPHRNAENALLTLFNQNISSRFLCNITVTLVTIICRILLY